MFAMSACTHKICKIFIKTQEKLKIVDNSGEEQCVRITPGFRSCKDPVESVRRRREVDRNLPDLGWVGNFSTLFPSSPVHVPVPHIPTYSVRPPPTQ